MTKEQFKQSQEYKEMMCKIESYTKGFCFTLDYTQIPKAKAKALEIVTSDSIKAGILESTSFCMDLEGNTTEESFKRI